MTTQPIRLLRASDLIGLPVVTIDRGEDVAEVRDVVYDGSNHQLIGVTLNKRGWFAGTMQDVLNVQQIAAIGPDAVTVLSESVLAEPVRLTEEHALRSDGHDVLGNTVVTSDGTKLGVVAGVVVSAGEQPAAVGYEVTDETGASVYVPVAVQLALSGEHVVVPAEATAFVRSDFVGFGAAVAEFRALLDGGVDPSDPSGTSDA